LHFKVQSNGVPVEALEGDDAIGESVERSKWDRDGDDLQFTLRSSWRVVPNVGGTRGLGRARAHAIIRA
jgi:hypothetical protein